MAAAGFSRRLVITWHLPHTVLTRKYLHRGQEWWWAGQMLLAAANASETCCPCSCIRFSLLHHLGPKVRKLCTKIAQKWTFSIMHEQVWVLLLLLNNYCSSWQRNSTQGKHCSYCLFPLFDPKMSFQLPPLLQKRAGCQSEGVIPNPNPTPACASPQAGPHGLAQLSKQCYSWREVPSIPTKLPLRYFSHGTARQDLCPCLFSPLLLGGYLPFARLTLLVRRRTPQAEGIWYPVVSYLQC